MLAADNAIIERDPGFPGDRERRSRMVARDEDRTDPGRGGQSLREGRRRRDRARRPRHRPEVSACSSGRNATARVHKASRAKASALSLFPAGEFAGAAFEQRSWRPLAEDGVALRPAAVLVYGSHHLALGRKTAPPPRAAAGIAGLHDRFPPRGRPPEERLRWDRLERSRLHPVV